MPSMSVLKNKGTMGIVSGLYLGRVAACLEMLKKSDDSLIQLYTFSKPLYELMFVGAVAGVESYLHARLRKEVFSSVSNCQAYVLSYLKHGNIKDSVLKSALQSIRNSSINFLPEGRDKELIIDTLNRHAYHNLKAISIKYYVPVCGLNLETCRNAKSFSEIVEMRHKVVHDGGRVNQSEFVDLTILGVCQAYETAINFIEEVECQFQEKGSTPLFYEDPTELEQF